LMVWEFWNRIDSRRQPGFLSDEKPG